MTRRESRIDGARAGRDLRPFDPLVDLVELWDEDRDPDLPIRTDRVARIVGLCPIPAGERIHLHPDGQLWPFPYLTEESPAMTTTATRDELRRNHHYGPGAASRRHGLCIHAEPFGSCGFAAPTTRGVLDEVGLERDRQEAKWGEQNHPDGTGPGLVLADAPVTFDDLRADDLEAWARARTEQLADAGACTYEAILTEEWAEAIAEGDPAKLRAELVQLAAVAVAWVEKIDRDAARA